MKNTIIILCLFMSFFTKAQFVEISDANFRNFLKSKYPSCFNTKNEMDTTCTAIIEETKIYCSGDSISSLEGIQYFDNLEELYCHHNLLKILPTLPTKLNYLKCDVNFLLTIPNLPKNLLDLSCNFNQLTQLPILPQNLVTLDCEYNELTKLPDLSPKLARLTCGHNQIIVLPELPESLLRLDCRINILSKLPKLPPKLEFFDCRYNQINSLSELPENLKALYCSENLLTKLPALPQKLQYFHCDENPINCLPTLPQTLVILRYSNTQIQCIPNYTIKITAQTSSLPLCTSPCQTTDNEDVTIENSNISLAPNPSENDTQFFVEEKIGIYDLSIFDISGKEIFTIKNQIGTIYLPTSHLPKGIYFVRIQAKNNEKTLKFIKI